MLANIKGGCSGNTPKHSVAFASKGKGGAVESRSLDVDDGELDDGDSELESEHASAIRAMHTTMAMSASGVARGNKKTVRHLQQVSGVTSKLEAWPQFCSHAVWFIFDYLF